MKLEMTEDNPPFLHLVLINYKENLCFKNSLYVFSSHPCGHFIALVKLKNIQSKLKQEVSFILFVFVCIVLYVYVCNRSIEIQK